LPGFGVTEYTSQNTTAKKNILDLYNTTSAHLVLETKQPSDLLGFVLYIVEQKLFLP